MSNDKPSNELKTRVQDSQLNLMTFTTGAFDMSTIKTVASKLSPQLKQVYDAIPFDSWIDSGALSQVTGIGRENISSALTNLRDKGLLFHMSIKKNGDRRRLMHKKANVLQRGKFRAVNRKEKSVKKFTPPDITPQEQTDVEPFAVRSRKVIDAVMVAVADLETLLHEVDDVMDTHEQIKKLTNK